MSGSPSHFCVEARCADATQAEIAAAEAWVAGAAGVEERDCEDGCTLLLLYLPAAVVSDAELAVASVSGVVLGERAAVADKDWSQAWRDGLEPTRVGERLVVRPSWIELPLAEGQVDLVIDPGQAFGTGGHVSTRLALEWIEAVAREGPGFGAAERLVDVGTGSGVLALAGLALGAGHAVGLDLDPEAGWAAREWAARNGLAERLDLFVGPVAALAGPGFDWLFANLLKSEMLPIVGEIARVVRPGGSAVFSGLLAEEGPEVEAQLVEAGFGAVRLRTAVDANGDEWISLLLRRMPRA
jgi:ribosomal protein L11 methyltransferase